MHEVTTVPAATEIEETVHLAVRQAKEITIENDEDLNSAGIFLRGLKTVLSQINKLLDTSIAATHKAHTEALAAKATLAKPIKNAESIVKDRIGKYQLEQERIRREEEQRRQREEEERQRKAREEEEARLAEAARLEEEGKTAEAEAVLDAPVEPEPAPLAPLPKPVTVAGVSVKSVWKWRLKDAGAIPREFLMIDDKLIDGIVKRKKGATNIPGIEPYEDKQVAARGL